MEDLEAILKKIKFARKTISKLNLDRDALIEDLTNQVLYYKDKEGKTLRQKAAFAGLSDRVKAYVKDDVTLSIDRIYQTNAVFEALENVVLATSGKGVGIRKLPMKIAGRTYLLPAFIAIYTAHRTFVDALGHLPGKELYEPSIKGRLNYFVDTQRRDLKMIFKLAGLGMLADKVGPDLESRIMHAAARRTNHWINSKGDVEEPWYMHPVNYLINALKGKPPSKTEPKQVMYDDIVKTPHYAVELLPAKSLPPTVYKVRK